MIEKLKKIFKWFPLSFALFFYLIFSPKVFAYTPGVNFVPSSSDYIIYYLPASCMGPEEPCDPWDENPESITIYYLTGNGVLSSNGFQYDFPCSHADILDSSGNIIGSFNPNTVGIMATDFSDGISINPNITLVGSFTAGNPISSNLYSDIFSGTLGVIISLLLILLPYALGIFAIYLATKTSKKLIKSFDGSGYRAGFEIGRSEFLTGQNKNSSDSSGDDFNKGISDGFNSEKIDTECDREGIKPLFNDHDDQAENFNKGII